MSYVTHMPTFLTYLRALRAEAPHVLACLRAFASYMPCVTYLLLFFLRALRTCCHFFTCLMCLRVLHVLRLFIFLRALRAFIFLRASRTFTFLFVFNFWHALCAFTFLRKMWNKP